MTLQQNDITLFDKDLVNTTEVFLRYGYKKTSLDDVAQHLGISRQTLYLRYQNKANLFKLAVTAKLESLKEECKETAKDTSLNNHDRLFKVIDIWDGEFVNIVKASPHAAEIVDVSHYLLEDVCDAKKSGFIDIIIDIFNNYESPALLMNKGQYYRVAETITYAVKGIIECSSDYEEFKDKVHNTVELIYPR